MGFLCQIPYISLQNLIIFRRELLKVLNQAGYLQQFLIKVKININNKHSHFYTWAVRQLIST